MAGSSSSLREGPQLAAAAAEGAAAAPSPAQYLSLEPLAYGEPKHSRCGELRRALSASAAEDQPEELKRIRASVVESSGRARERTRSLQEYIQKLDKYRTRKRQRGDSVTERLGSGSSGALRIGAQNNSTVMSKRVRSSLADGRLEGRGNHPTRQGPSNNIEKSSPVEKEKCCARASGAALGLSEDKLRCLSPGGEGWEKKLKRKRSVGTMLSRSSDVDRDVKLAGQHRLTNEARVRSTDGLAYRHGASAGALGGSKMDGSSQQSNAGSRLLPKTDMDYGTLPNERRERHAGLEKERFMVKGNKAHTSEDMQAGSLSALTKGKACRAPRTSSLAMNSSSSFQRSAGGSDEWEETPYPNKASPLGGTANRKRPAPSSASSPPVAWGGQRPQKMSRARRANVVSPVSNFDEALSEGSPLDNAARSAPVESCGLLLTKSVACNNMQTVNKMDSISSPVGLSESEGSAATENKAKEKASNSGEVDEGANAVHNATGLILSSNKSRIPLREELEDGGVRRQGRSGRGTMHVKGCSSISKEKLEMIETRKPLKCGRPGSEKNESKVGRTPTKKGSDRKASSWHTPILDCVPTNMTGEPEDDREELLAAVNAARSAIVGAYSGPFWKKMEPMLTFISTENISFLKHQVTFVEELEMGMSCMPDGELDMTASTDYNRSQTTGELSSQVQSKANGVRAKEHIDILSPNEEHCSIEPQKIKEDECFDEMVQLRHRLFSALMVEEDGNDLSDSNGVQVQGDILLEFSNDHIPYTASRFLENELEASAVTSNFGLNLDFKHSNNNSVVHENMCNGFRASGNFMNSNCHNSVQSENLSDGVNSTMYPENGSFHEFKPHISRQCQNHGKSFSLPPYDYQYRQMPVDDKILIELHSIDIYPETLPKLDDGEDEDINKIISELRKRMHDQVKQKKYQLHKLEKEIQDTKNIEERSLEQHAMNKLVERAYKRLKGGRVGSSHKGGISKAASKAAKQLTLSFAKRTLARCQKFEETGRSCFSEPFLWSVLSAPLPSSDAKLTEGATPVAGERQKLQKLDRSPLDQGGSKWKKSDKERDQNRDASAKNSSLKSGRHSSGSGRSERKNKTKPKQKLAQLSTSGNVLCTVVESLPTPSMQEPHESTCASDVKITQQLSNCSGNVQKPTDSALTNLPGIDSIDMLDVPEGLDGHGNDISWFIDGLDDSLQDIDFSGGLEIPDDDLNQLGFI